MPLIHQQQNFLLQCNNECYCVGSSDEVTNSLDYCYQEWMVPLTYQESSQGAAAQKRQLLGLSGPSPYGAAGTTGAAVVGFSQW